MRVETATRFLTSVVDDEDCAYSTQKQALNALALFFKYVLEVEDPVFNVKLRDTGTRIPVVLSKPETQKLFNGLKEQEAKAIPDKEKDQEKSYCRYELAARLQYGAGLRLPCLSHIMNTPNPAGGFAPPLTSSKSSSLKPSPCPGSSVQRGIFENWIWRDNPADWKR